MTPYAQRMLEIIAAHAYGAALDYHEIHIALDPERNHRGNEDPTVDALGELIDAGLVAQYVGSVNWGTTEQVAIDAWWDEFIDVWNTVGHCEQPFGDSRVDQDVEASIADGVCGLVVFDTGQTNARGMT